jgi:hypothetical protein
MNESNRRILFVVLFAVVLFQTGAHISQAFVNDPAWVFISMDSFPEYHRVVAEGAFRFLLLPRVLELVLAIAVLCFRPAMSKRWVLVLAIALALCAFLVTAFIQRPISAQLETIGNTPELLSRLRATGWLSLTPELLRDALYLWMMLLMVRPQAQVRAARTEPYGDAA